MDLSNVVKHHFFATIGWRRRQCEYEIVAVFGITLSRAAQYPPASQAESDIKRPNFAYKIPKMAIG